MASALAGGVVFHSQHEDAADDAVDGQWGVRCAGQRSMRTVKDVAFVGPRQTLVAAGSDCGCLLLWRRASGQLVNVLRADSSVVNCIQVSWWVI